MIDTPSGKKAILTHDEARSMVRERQFPLLVECYPWKQITQSPCGFRRLPPQAPVRDHKTGFALGTKKVGPKRRISSPQPREHLPPKYGRIADKRGTQQ